jgi:hypothetical protein
MFSLKYSKLRALGVATILFYEIRLTSGSHNVAAIKAVMEIF